MPTQSSSGPRGSGGCGRWSSSDYLPWLAICSGRRGNLPVSGLPTAFSASPSLTSHKRQLGALAILVLLSACGGDSGSDGTGPSLDDTPQTVNVVSPSDTLTWIGQTAQLSATVLNASGATLGLTVTWQSTAPSVVGVSSSGQVTALSNGTATIRATAGTATGSVLITVRQVSTELTKVDGDAQEGPVGAVLPAPLVVELRDMGGTAVSGAPVSWDIDSGTGALDEAAALTDADGRSTARWRLGDQVGSQAVLVQGGPDLQATFTATATDPPASVEVTGPSDSLTFIGQTVQLEATVRGVSGRELDVSVSWDSDTPTVAEVSDQGLVTAISNGSASIRANAEDLTGEVAITVAQVPTEILRVAGNEQSGTTGTTLPDALVIEVQDEGGSSVEGVSVTWDVSMGSGTLSDASSVTNADGQADAIWSLGDEVGEQRVSVEAAGDLQTSFTATAVSQGTYVVVIDEITPATLVEGQSATITGSGFSEIGSENTVLVDQLEASIRSATSTTIRITVPSSDCRPRRVAEVAVVRGGSQDSQSSTVEPAEILSPAVGEVWYSGSDNCMHFAGRAAGASYVIGLLSTVESPSAVSTPTLEVRPASTGASVAHAAPPRGSLREGAAVRLPRATPPAAARVAPQQTPVTPPRSALGSEDRARRKAELWREYMAIRERLPATASRFRFAAAVRAPLEVGDVITINTGSGCTDRPSTDAEVRYVGSAAVWLEDLSNPSGGFESNDYASLDDVYSDAIAPALEDYFGTTNDIDANDRILVLVSKSVNQEEDLLGFVWGGDLLSSSTCTDSNEAEIFYGLAPDPAGEFGTVRTKSDVLDLYPALIAHEVTHVLQFSQGVPLSRWESEGGATLAELLVGPEVLGHVRQGLGAAELDDGFQWYGGWFSDVAQMGGWTSTQKIQNTPERCTWLGTEDDGNTGPCEGKNRAVYGTPATVLLMLVDWLGSTYPGGERALVRDLTSSPFEGFRAVEELTDRSIVELLTVFYSHFWMAQRGWTTVFDSWDMADVFDRGSPTYLWLGEQADFTDFDYWDDVRGGSNSYLEWFPSGGHLQTSMGLRGPDGSTASSELRFWVLRTN